MWNFAVTMIFSMADLIIVGRMSGRWPRWSWQWPRWRCCRRRSRRSTWCSARAAPYVTDYQKRLQGIVAEETYSQNVLRNVHGPRRGSVRPSLSREGRELQSDVLMVKLGGEDWWMQFRDVFEVDHRPVRDRDQRLYKLFVDAKADARAQAESIQQESSRYNIGPVMRTINIPILALMFFQNGTTSRAIHARQDGQRQENRFARRSPTTIWVIEFRESGPGTMVTRRQPAATYRRTAASGSTAPPAASCERSTSRTRKICAR